MKEHKKSIFVYCTLSLVFVAVIVSSQQMSYSKGLPVNMINPLVETTNDDIDILLLMDDTYGGNFEGILNKFQNFGWNITIAGPNPTLDGCFFISGQTVDADILISEIDDVSQFDCVNIMPGNSHDYLRTNTKALNLIKAAVAANLVVSAWCRGVRVLAAADVLDGKNITGHKDYRGDYESAGATFFDGSAPIIDGKIVTGVRSRFYQTEMCIAIAKALGVHETEVPTIGEITVNSLGSNSYNLSLTPVDASGIATAKVKLCPVNLPEDVTASIITVTLTDDNSDGIYTKTLVNLRPVNYSVNVELTDIFFNEVTYEDYIAINNSDSGNGSLIIPVVTLTIFGGVFFQFKRRKTKND